MDLVDNPESHARLDESLTRRIWGELCRAVAWMHSVGLVHRDIKLESKSSFLFLQVPPIESSVALARYPAHGRPPRAPAPVALPHQTDRLRPLAFHRPCATTTYDPLWLRLVRSARARHGQAIRRTPDRCVGVWGRSLRARHPSPAIRRPYAPSRTSRRIATGDGPRGPSAQTRGTQSAAQPHRGGHVLVA